MVTGVLGARLLRSTIPVISVTCPGSPRSVPRRLHRMRSKQGRRLSSLFLNSVSLLSTDQQLGPHFGGDKKPSRRSLSHSVTKPDCPQATRIVPPQIQRVFSQSRQWDAVIAEKLQTHEIAIAMRRAYDGNDFRNRIECATFPILLHHESQVLMWVRRELGSRRLGRCYH